MTRSRQRLEDVAERIAGDVDLAADALAQQIGARALGRREQHVGEPVGLDPVVLLGHVHAS